MSLNPASINVGKTSTASVPADFSGGTFSSNNLPVATVSGSTVTGVTAGSATISGSGWANSNGATGCSLSGAILTITSPPPPQQPTITSLAPSVFRCDAECDFVNETMLGSGFEVGDFVNTVPDAWIQLVLLVNAGESLVTLGLDTPHSSPGSFTFSECRTATNNCSNPWNIAYVGNQNDLVIGPDGELYNLDRTVGQIWKFKSNGSPDGGITTLALPGEVSIAFDDTDSLVWISRLAQVDGYFAATGEPAVGTTRDGNTVSDGGAETGFYCGTEAGTGRLACLDGEPNTNPTFAYAPAGTEPWSLTMLTLGPGTQSQETDALAYDREGTAFYRFAVSLPAGADKPTITLKSMPANPLVMNELTPADSLTGTGKGGWYLVPFETGPAAGTVAFLSPYDDLVVFIDVSTMTATPATLPIGSGVPFRIAADKTNGRAIVAFANVGAATSTTFAAVTPLGTVTPLTATAQNLIAVGLGVSADGTKLYACMRNQCQALPNQ